MDKTHHGPVIALFSLQLQQLFSYVRGLLVTNHFSMFLIDRYIFAIQQFITHEEHLQYSLWYVAIFWTASKALAPWSQQQKVSKTTSKPLSLSNSSQKSPFFAFWCMLCTATPDISNSSENINNTARVSRVPFLFLWLWYRIDTFTV